MREQPKGLTLDRPEAFSQPQPASAELVVKDFRSSRRGGFMAENESERYIVNIPHYCINKHLKAFAELHVM